MGLKQVVNVAKKKKVTSARTKKTTTITIYPLPNLTEHKKATYNPLYYYPNRLFSYDPKKYWYYVCIGSRGRGKTVSAWRWVLKRFMKYGERFVWLRLTEAPIKKASRNQGSTLAPQFLLDQLGINELSMRGNIIYVKVTKNDKTREYMAGAMDAISTFYTSKGQDMSGYTNVVFDEINRESGERSTFDITRAFINQIETIARLRIIRVLMLGNTILDTSEILGLFNFQPKKFGIYKLTRKHCIIEYLDDTEAFKLARKNSMAGTLLGDNKEISASFTNVTAGYMDNVTKFLPNFKQIFIYYIADFKAYGIYEMKKSGLFVGEVRMPSQEKYKISPYLNCVGKYQKEIYEKFYELISQNLLYFESAAVRLRFLGALKNNRTSLQ